MQRAVSTRVLTEDRVGKPRCSKVLTIIGFVLPAFLVYSLFVIYPIFQAAYYSLYKWKGLGPLSNNVGLDNFRNALSDNVFQYAILHNLTIALLTVLLQLPFSLFIALLIRGNMWGRAIFRTIFFLPFVLSEVITAVVWLFLFRADNGLINVILEAIIPGFTERSWLGNPSTVLYTVFVVITWKYFGFHMTLMLAGLQNIPSDLEDAARVDGATSARVLRDITIPLLMPTVRVSAFLAILGALQFFDLMWVMTKGGPVNASNTMATYMYTYGFQRFQLGYGAAISLVIFGICFLFSLAYQRMIMRRDFDGAVT